MARLEAQGAEQSQFAAAFPDAAQEHDRQTRSPEQETEAAERLERVEVRVLDGEVAAQAADRCRYQGALIGESGLEILLHGDESCLIRGIHFVHPVAWGFDEEELEAL